MTIAITIIGGIVVGLVTVGSPVWRIFGVSIAAVLLVIPMTMNPLPLVSHRVTLTLAVIVGLRVIDLSVERPSRRAALRLLHIFMPFDTRLATRSRPRWHVFQVLQTAAWAMLAYIAFKAAAMSPVAPPSAYYAVRWFFGMLFVAALFEAIACAISLLLAMVGVEVPALHDAPYKAHSLREFWSVRWNKPVGRWLREHIYAPLARRGNQDLALTASFTVSAAVHFYVATALLDARWGLIMASLFLLQVPLLRAEDAMKIRRRATFIGRIWTLSVLIVLSPLFTEPVLRIFGLFP